MMQLPVQRIGDLPKDIMLLEADDLALSGRGGSEGAGYSDPAMFCF